MGIGPMWVYARRKRRGAIVYLLITIDTEGDNAWAGKGYENHTRNARYVPRFHRLCVRYGFKPTYLVTHEMARDDGFVAFARDALARQECEIGCHPHAWNQPPEHAVTSNDTRHLPYLIEYPASIMERKVALLTDLIRERFGVTPTSHRAGRWAMNTAYARILTDLGYTVDTSVTPHDRDAVRDRPFPDHVNVPIPDYSTFPSAPYFVHEDDFSRPGDTALLEIPMTIVPRYAPRWRALYWATPWRQVRRAARAVFGQPIAWFRPNGRNDRSMHAIADAKLAGDTSTSAQSNNRDSRVGDDYLMLMLHSSELMPGCNPTFRNQSDIDGLYGSLEYLFHSLANRGVRGFTCRDYRAHYAAHARRA